MAEILFISLIGIFSSSPCDSAAQITDLNYLVEIHFNVLEINQVSFCPLCFAAQLHKCILMMKNHNVSLEDSSSTPSF